MQIYRGADPEPRRYPTHQYLTDYLMPNYIVTGVGQSVQQKGDPISRWVLHCTRRKPVVLLVAGGSGDGKTVIGKCLGRQGTPVYRTDALFRRLMESPLYARTRLANVLRERHGGKGAVVKAVALLEEVPELVDEFANIVCDEAALDAPVSVIEGEVLRRPMIEAALSRALEGRGAVVWDTRRSRADFADEPALLRAAE
jgi:hypothetical protein